MARILAIDYGTKRCGIAVTDPLQIIAGGLTTVPTAELLPFLEKYLEEEEVETIVVGQPFHLDGTPAQLTPQIRGLVRQLKRRFPGVRLALHDERLSSEEAKKVILASGAKKKKRRDKALVDRVSAAIILQDYLATHRNEP